ncbi:anti-anti-sigma factor (plasmid) [Streptomyces sp. SGAir0957]
MAVTPRVEGGATVLEVRGEIDYETGGPLQAALASACAGTAPQCVVDLGGVAFLDSSGLSILLAAYGRATAAGGWLRLARVSPPVLRVLTIVGLDSVVPIYPTMQAALA